MGKVTFTVLILIAVAWFVGAPWVALGALVLGNLALAVSLFIAWIITIWVTITTV